MGMDVQGLLASVFGHAAFRPLQREAVDAFVAGRDVVLVLPTGAGKSICFQLPAVALAREGLGPTLVVSPLIALMNDQVSALRARGVRAVALHSGMAWPEQRSTLLDMASLELVYVSPERLQNSRFQQVVAHARFARAVIDEAHCISEWGHDFRPEYRALGFLKSELKLPLMAVTATATPRVRDDISRSLQLVDPLRLAGPFARPNLRYAVHVADKGQSRTAWVAELLKARGYACRSTPGHAIVYTVTRKRAQEVQKALRAAGIKAGYYHAGRNDSARSKAHSLFETGKTPVLVATSAYGMGVDIASVRMVLHVEAPATLEAYTQQAGRAGRDGLPSECWLAYSPSDARIHARIQGARSAAKVAKAFELLGAYAHGDACRQVLMARHFSDDGCAPCGVCDLCSDPDAVRVRRAPADGVASPLRNSERPVRALEESQLELVVAFVDALSKPVGRRVIVKALRGSKARDVVKKRLTGNPHFGSLRDSSDEAIFQALDALLARGLLIPKGQKYPTLWVAGKAVRPKRAVNTGERRKPSTLEAALKSYRRAEAKRRRIKPYQVFQNRTLSALCEERPCSEQQLLEIWGLGDERIRKYGGDLLKLIAGLPTAAASGKSRRTKVTSATRAQPAIRNAG